MGVWGDTWNSIKSAPGDLYDSAKNTGEWIISGSPESALFSPLGFGVWGYNALDDQFGEQSPSAIKGPSYDDQIKKYWKGLVQNGMSDADARKLTLSYAQQLDPKNAQQLIDKNLGEPYRAAKDTKYVNDPKKTDLANAMGSFYSQMGNKKKDFIAAAGGGDSRTSRGGLPENISKFDAKKDYALSNDTLMEKSRNDQTNILRGQAKQLADYTAVGAKQDNTTISDLTNRQAQGQRSAENIKAFAGDAPNASMAFQNSLQGQNKFGDYLKVTNDKAVELNGLQKGINAGYSAVQASDASRGISFDQQQQALAQQAYAKKQAEAEANQRYEDARLGAISQLGVPGMIYATGSRVTAGAPSAPTYNDPGAAASSTPSDKTNKKDISQQLFEKAKPYKFSYKNELINKISKGKTRHDKEVIKLNYSEPRMGIMAQDLEKSKPGREIVTDDPQLGKVLDNQKSISALFASVSAQQQQLTDNKRQMNQMNNSLIKLLKKK